MKTLFLLLLACSLGFAKHMPADSLKNERVEDRTMQSIQLQEIYIYGENPDGDACTCSASKCTEMLMGEMEGISLIHRGNFAQEAVIHGLTGEQITMTIDGMHIFGACTDKMDPVSVYVEKNNLRKIQAITQSSDFSRGQNIGGSINLITMKPEFSNGISGSLFTGYESASVVKKGEGTVNFAHDDYSFRLSYAWKNAGDFFAGKGRRIANSGFNKSNVKADASYRLPTTGTFTLSYIGDFAHDIGYPAMLMDARKTNAQMFSASLNGMRDTVFASPIVYNMKMYANTILHWMDDYSRSVTEIQSRIVMPGMYMPMSGITNTYGANADAAIEADAYLLQLNVDLYRLQAFADMTMLSLQQNEPPMYLYNIGDARIDNATVNAKCTHFFANTGSVSMSAAYTFVQRSLLKDDGKKMLQVYIGDEVKAVANHLVSVNLSGELPLGSTSKVFASVSRATRAPSQAESFGYFLYNLGDDAIYVGKPDIKPERSLQGVLGWQYKNKNNRAQLSLFYNYVEDYIGGKVIEEANPGNTLFPQAIKVYDNIGTVGIYGIDISGRTQFADDFFAEASFAYQHGRAITQKDYLPVTPPLRGLCSVSYGTENWGAVETQFAFSQNAVSTVLAREDKTPGYIIWNLRTGVVIGAGFSILAGIENIFDTLYHHHSSIGNLPDRGRNVYAQLGYQF